jgi:hypothetical protein
MTTVGSSSISGVTKSGAPVWRATVMASLGRACVHVLWRLHDHVVDGDLDHRDLLLFAHIRPDRGIELRGEQTSEPAARVLTLTNDSGWNESRSDPR